MLNRVALQNFIRNESDLVAQIRSQSSKPMKPIPLSSFVTPCGPRDGKLTGKFGYPPRLASFGTGMEILYSGMGWVWVPSQKPDSGLGQV